MKKIKTLSAFTIVSMISILVIGCRPTPEVPPIVNRSGGIEKEAIIAPLQEHEVKKIEAPKSWNEEITKGEGRVHITSKDVSLDIPIVKNTPILQIKKREFNQSLLEKLVSYFTGSSKLYETPKMTKEELSYWSERINKRLGIYGDPKESSYISSQISNIENLLKDAPIEKELKICKPKFSNAQQSEYLYVRRGEKDKGIENKESFNAIVENNKAMIKAERNESGGGSSGSFCYAKGDYLDEDYLSNAKKNYESLTKGDSIADKEWIESYDLFIKQLETSLTANKLSEESIKQQAIKIVNELGISELSMVNASPCTYSPTSLEWDKMDVDWSKVEQGYVIEFARASGELVAKIPHSSFVYGDSLPEKTYSPSFFPESLTMVFTNNGLQIFEWTNMAQMVKAIADNTRLLPFEQIKERFAQHLFYQAASEDENSEKGLKVSERYVIKEVSLRAYYTDAFENPEQAWLVPVWFFTYEYYRKVGETENYMGDLSAMIQAVDGGYIQLLP